MSVKIRLSKTGRKNLPSFRIVATPTRSKRDGKVLEILGFYNPSMNPPSFSIKKERIEYWKGVGARVTEAVEKLLEGKYEFKAYRPNKKGTQETKTEEKSVIKKENEKPKET